MNFHEMLSVISKQFPAFKNEDELEDTFSKFLSKRGYNILPKGKIPSDLVTHQDTITPDIIAETEEKIGIELKYVVLQLETNTSQKNRRGNPIAFSYDVLKDCVRCEQLIRDGHVNNACVIGITNVSKLWSTPNQAWSKASSYETTKTTSNTIQGFIQTHGIDPDKAIFKHHRYSLFLEFEWQFEWVDYSQVNCNKGNGHFKALILRPNFSAPKAIRNLDPHLNLGTLPFENQTIKDQALSLRKK